MTCTCTPVQQLAVGSPRRMSDDRLCFCKAARWDQRVTSCWEVTSTQQAYHLDRVRPRRPLIERQADFTIVIEPRFLRVYYCFSIPSLYGAALWHQPGAR